jgi:hypothetical protein
VIFCGEGGHAPIEARNISQAKASLRNQQSRGRALGRLFAFTALRDARANAKPTRSNETNGTGRNSR